MEQVKFNVFQRKVKNGTNEFTVYSSKLGLNNTYYEIRFTDTVDNKNLIPSKKPFVLVTEQGQFSPSKQKRTASNGETYEKNILYVRKIVAVEDYIDPVVDINDL